ncbi:MAG: LacI family transcriptional regulator [Treponema sp.]|jgi:LacI family transcriptional regulator|nr:LacI family transcriptional regulator [Treponema sp.]
MIFLTKSLFFYDFFRFCLVFISFLSYTVIKRFITSNEEGMGVTIKDIARKTGLSITSISLVLNKKENRISEKTKQIIESAAEEMHYSPNQAAISLATKKTNTIGLILSEGGYYTSSDMVNSFERVCKNAGYSLILSLPQGDGEACLEAIETVLRRGADAAIFDPSLLGEAFYSVYAGLLEKAEVPLFSLAPAGSPALSNSFAPDHRQGGYLGTTHLLELGHRNIGCILGPQDSWAVSCFSAGIQEALREFDRDPAGIPVIFKSHTADAGYESLGGLLEQGVTGIITGSDIIASGILRRAYELRIPVPEQLSVVGYGNCSFAADLYVPLTTVSVHFDRIARKVVNVIRNLNQKGQAVPSEFIQPSLVVRKSTAPLA